MTITSTDTRIAYAGNGTSTAFAVPFQFFGPDELRVYQVDADEVQTLLERGVHYTVTGGAGSTGTAASGTVLAVTAPASGTTWSILRSTTATQQVVLANAGPMPGPTLERMADRLTAVAQEDLDALSRTIRVPAGEAASVPVLPSRTDRAGLALTFDSNGDPTASALVTNTAAISAAMIPVVGGATLITARALLGGRKHVNVVTDFGADNTNASDAKAAIQAAINSLTSGVVYLPPGIYGLASGLTLKPLVTLVADDPLMTTLMARANSVNLLSYTAAALTTGFTIQRLGLSGGGFTGVKGIHLDGTDSAKRLSLVSIEDCYAALCATGFSLKFCASSRLENARANASTNGIVINQCADTEVDGGWAQNGGNVGLWVVGGPGAYDEGLRVSDFSTNGQVKGVFVDGQDWGSLSGCSFTTCSGGPAIFAASSNWKISDCDFATGGGAPATPGFTTDALCAGLQLSNNLCSINTFGFNLLGSDHVVSGNRFLANSNVDINIEAVRSVVTGNNCASTGVVQSITEQVGANYNNISGNITNGTVVIVGANSAVNGNNVVY